MRSARRQHRRTQRIPLKGVRDGRYKAMREALAVVRPAAGAEEAVAEVSDVESDLIRLVFTLSSSSNATCLQDTRPGRKESYGPIRFYHRPLLYTAVGQHSVCTKAQ